MECNTTQEVATGGAGKGEELEGGEGPEEEATHTGRTEVARNGVDKSQILERESEKSMVLSLHMHIIVTCFTLQWCNQYCLPRPYINFSSKR